MLSSLGFICRVKGRKRHRLLLLFMLGWKKGVEEFHENVWSLKDHLVPWGRMIWRGPGWRHGDCCWGNPAWWWPDIRCSNGDEEKQINLGIIKSLTMLKSASLTQMIGTARWKLKRGKLTRSPRTYLWSREGIPAQNSKEHYHRKRGGGWRPGKGTEIQRGN